MEFTEKPVVLSKRNVVMETITEPEVTPKEWVPKYAGRIMSKADFLKWESDDVFVYEFNDGVLEPSFSMKPEEFYLAKRLTRRFAATQAYQQGAELMPEVECWLTEKQMRRPDFILYRGAGTATGSRKPRHSRLRRGTDFRIRYHPNDGNKASGVRSRQASRWFGGYCRLLNL